MEGKEAFVLQTYKHQHETGNEPTLEDAKSFLNDLKHGAPYPHGNETSGDVVSWFRARGQMVLAGMLAGSMFIIAICKLWIQTRTCLHELDAMDLYDDPTEALRKYKIMPIHHLMVDPGNTDPRQKLAVAISKMSDEQVSDLLETLVPDRTEQPPETEQEGQ